MSILKQEPNYTLTPTSKELEDLAAVMSFSSTGDILNVICFYSLISNY